MQPFDYAKLRCIPRSVLVEHEVCPSGDEGVVTTLCLWDPDDRERADRAAAALAPHLPRVTRIEFAQVLPAEGFRPSEWLAQLVDHIYADDSTPAGSTA
jgi:hypothetical protein